MFDRGTARRRGRLLLLLIVVIVVGLAAACGDSPEELQGRVDDPTPQLAAVSLPDGSSDGTEFDIRADPGEVLLVYFGYTSCPDVCPTTLADVSVAVRSLDEDEAERVDLAMVSIDPDRDEDVLVDYVDSFLEGSHALVTTDDERLRAVADEFGATYSVELSADGTTDVTHTSSVFAVDADGRIPVQWPFGTSSDVLAADLRILLGRL